MEISNKMQFHGEKMEDVTIVEKILRSLTPTFDYIVCSIEESKDIDAFSLDELQNSLLAKAGDEINILTNPRYSDLDVINLIIIGFHSTVSFGDCSTVRVMGKDNIEIRIKNGFVEIISNVLYVPDLKSNLLRTGQLQENDYVITIQKGVCEIYDPTRRAIVVVQMSLNMLFPLKIESVQSCLVAEVKDPSLLWHFHYGHLSFGGLKTLQQKNMVTGLLHISIPSQKKSEAFCAFKSFNARVENETGKTIKTLRIDHSGEYYSTEFEIFCDVHGIRKELTAAYTPQKNGVSERKNRTILNMVRSLLARGRIPKSFWPEVVNWSIHILNRSPTFVVQNMTPEEAWSRRRLAVDYFKIFDCIAYAHILDEKRKKLDDKREKCVFLGVSETSKAYKFFNSLTQKIVTSRDVVFDEKNTWDWNGQEPYLSSFLQ
ncbi:uncharacterized protein LOC122306472 [Carya illinoinensis]|uniref:uncharacterized protein LOC122306472 n=1 Tax=Carya illinoinensis TaxID=32201 RepID=UPI001C71944F|nr:uncharacterized protein LOC122306472 [Carya illinoinensis]